VLGDRPRLQQVLLNLIVNAWDAIGDLGDIGGELTISARRASSARAMASPPTPANAAPGSAVIDLTLADSGPGIPPELLPRVFDPFFTTKAVGHGSGLGLFISHEIIEEHGGCISVANRPEGGAEFRIRLPEVRSQWKPPPPPLPPENKKDNAMTARLLLVDDERIALRNLEHVLAKEGYQVTATQSGGMPWNCSTASPSTWCSPT
jgi:two-component system cell cycle sensor histidine kinase/response regulator CckA